MNHTRVDNTLPPACRPRTARALAAWAAALLGLLVAAAPAWSDPLDEDPDFVAAACAFSNNQYDQAISELVSLLGRYPRHWRVQMLLADAYERSGRPLAARKLYDAVLTGNPPGRAQLVARQAVERLTRQMETNRPDSGQVTPRQIAEMSVSFPEQTRRLTPHFEITTSNPTLAGVLAGRAETVLDRVRRTVLGGQLYPHRIELTVFANEKTFRASSVAPHWSGGGFKLTVRPDGTYRRQVLLWQLDDENRFRSSLLTRELPHELAHVVLREFFGQAACPLWLDEGLACLAQDDGGRDMASRMSELLRADAAVQLVDFIDQVNPDLDRPANFYVQAASWTRYLRSNMTDAQMKTFLGHLKDGHKPSVALSRTLFLDNQRNWLSDMEERWHQWALLNGNGGEDSTLPDNSAAAPTSGTEE